MVASADPDSRASPGPGSQRGRAQGAAVPQPGHYPWQYGCDARAPRPPQPERGPGRRPRPAANDHSAWYCLNTAGISTMAHCRWHQAPLAATKSDRIINFDYHHDAMDIPEFLAYSSRFLIISD